MAIDKDTQPNQTILPARKQLFCKQEDASTVTKSGFFLTNGAAEETRPQLAEVINIGLDVKDYKPHDRIVYKSYSTTSINLDRVSYFIIAEEDVLGTMLDVRANEQE